MILRSKIGNTELLELYGYEPMDRQHSISQAWEALSSRYHMEDAPIFGEMRQAMLRAHKECYPDDERWE